MPKKIFYKNVAGGIDKKTPKWLIPANKWSDGMNVHFGDNWVRKCDGWKKMLPDPLNGHVYHIDILSQTNGSKFLLLHTPTKLYSYISDVNVTEVLSGETLSGTIDKMITSAVAQDCYMFTNQVDPPCIWNGSDKLKKMPGLYQPSSWSNKAYEVGDCVLGGGKVRICIIAGNSGITQPVWPSSGDITDGAVTWTTSGAPGLYGGGLSLTSCRSLTYFNNFLILGGTVEDGTVYPQRIRWSQIGDIYRYNNESDGSGQAGYIDIFDTPDWVQAMKQLSNYLVIYKENSIHVVSYVGGDMVFDRRVSVFGKGLIAPRAVVDTGKEHLFVGGDNIYSFNLMEPEVICDEISSDLFRLIDPQYVSNMNSYFIPSLHEAWFSFTSVNSAQHTNDMALIINTKTRAASIRELPMTSFGRWVYTADNSWDSDTGTWDEDTTRWDDSKQMTTSTMYLCGDSAGYVYEIAGNSKDGGDMFGFVTTGMMDFGDPENMKRLLRIQMMLARQGIYDLNVDIGTANSVDDDIVWSGQHQLHLGGGVNPWVDCDLTGRYFYVKLYTEKANEPFEISGIQFYFETRGPV